MSDPHSTTPRPSVAPTAASEATPRRRSRRRWRLPALGTPPGHLRPAFKDVDSWWTVLVIDPLATHALPPLLRRSWVTPNRLTAASGVLGLASGAAFVTGRPRLGAVLYEGRFFLDCLDGKVARMQGVKSRYGHFLDGAFDFAGTTWAAAGVGWWLVRSGAVRREAALAPLAASVIWAWTQSQRWAFSALARETPLPAPAPCPDDDDGSGDDVDRGLAEALRQRRLTRLPSSVEAETLALFLGPLTGSPRVAAAASYTALAGFYAPSVLNNLVGTARALQASERSASGSTS